MKLGAAVLVGRAYELGISSSLRFLWSSYVHQSHRRDSMNGFSVVRPVTRTGFWSLN